MNEEAFKKWLNDNNLKRTKKLVSDCVARVRYVETSFEKSLGRPYDLDEEFKIDGLVHLREMLANNGDNEALRNTIPQGAAMPVDVGNRSVGALANAILQYQRFREEIDVDDI